MTTAYFDCYNGISGDMTLGALVDLGLPVEDLRSALASLPVQGYALEATRVKRCGIGACQVHVKTDEHHPHRHLSHIREIIEKSDFASHVKERAISAFEKLAQAEARIHETTVEKIHFHEVGAVDAIVDIVGAMWGIDALGIDRVTVSPVAVGSGTVKCSHGEMPVPAPATALLLRGVPITSGPSNAGELTTPTGAVILATVANSFGPITDLQVERIGYGAGTREIAGHTNYLRILVGTETASAALPVESRELAVVQTEIDDMPGELFGHVLEKLFAAGCLDAHVVPVQMKKNRPGSSLQALVAPEQVNAIIELMLRETTTFGVKVVPCRRHCLRRSFDKVETPLGPVQVKVGYWGDEILKVTPEYEDCRRIAGEKQMPLSEVYAAANVAIREWIAGRRPA